MSRPVDCSARLPRRWASRPTPRPGWSTRWRTADVVAAEDTRRVRTLAQALGVRDRGQGGQPLRPERGGAGARRWSTEIAAGATVLLVSDAGMPLINDPGYRLVTACVEAGLTGHLPARSVGGDDGAGGLGAALRTGSASRGSRRASSRRARRGWPALAAEPRTACSSSHRAGSRTACATPSTILGAERRAVVCRELTKTHEEIVRGSLAELADWAADGVLGEITVVLAGATPQADVPSAGGRGAGWSTTGCGSRTPARR